MRFDTTGMLWDDPVRQGRQGQKIRIIPPVPDTGWTYPRDFPNLSGEKVLGFDTETYDPNLLTHGAGWATNDGEIIGVSLATKDGGKWYWPLAHQYSPEENVSNPAPVFAFLKDILENPSITKVGANLLYDVGWMLTEGINVQGKLLDVLYASALINELELRGNNLETISDFYLGRGKETSLLYEWSSKAYGGKPNGTQRANLYRCPPSLVGPYAEQDADLPIHVMMHQWPKIQSLGLTDVFDLECRLIPLLLRMRLRGVCIDEERASVVLKDVLGIRDKAQEALNKEAGFPINVYAAVDIARYCDKNEIEYPMTEKGAPSFRRAWLANHTHPSMGLIKDIRRYDKAGGSFIQNAILDKHIGGKLYPTFHPLREETTLGDTRGTGYGRFSSSNPNAQQIPSRDKELAPKIRGCFVPEPGYGSWLKMDLSQIEYRFFAHYAVNGFKLQSAYQDPKTDFHDTVSASLEHKIPRGPVKNINFGKLYGMQVYTFSNQLREQLGHNQITELLVHSALDPDEKDPYLQYAKYASALYDDKFPEARRTLEAYSDMASMHGQVRTVMGRIARFDFWGPMDWKSKKKPVYGTRQAATEKLGTHAIERQHCHKALNHVLQGSAADLLKKGMVDAYEAGVFERLGYPHLTVHDELDFSYNEDLRKPAQELAWYVENALKLRVPVIMDAEVGPDWGHVEKYNLF